jgi:branched-chain amino acid transport system permease protein
MIALVPEFLLLGLVIGAIYALFALGLTLIFGVMDVVNVAHGELFTLGGYVTLLAIVGLSLPSAVGASAAVLSVAAIAVLIYRGLVAPLQRRIAPSRRGNATLVLTLGLSIVIQNGLLAVAGAEYQRVPSFASGATQIFGLYIANHRLLILGLAALLTALLFAWLKWARIGLAIRAVVQNPSAAEAVGINLSRIRTITWGLAGGLAGAAAALLVPILTVFPHVGFNLTIKAFAVVVIGGMGNLLGACIAGYGLGVIEALTTMIISSEYRDIASYSVMLLVLLTRPEGLFGGRAR